MTRTLSIALALSCILLAGLWWVSSSTSSVLTAILCAAALGVSLDHLWGQVSPDVAGWRVAGLEFLSRRLPDAVLAGLSRWGDCLVLGGVTLAMTLSALWPIPFEHPLSQDHANHYLNLEIFWELLSSGHLFGWTDRVATGRPFGDTYGTLVYLLPTIPKVLSLGLLSTATCYALAVFCVWWVGALVVGGITRKLTSGWFAAWLASAAFLLDVGADREGGWVYSMFHAVWPQWFASMMFLWAVWALVQLWEEPSRRRLAWSMGLIGVSIWMHPMNALNFAIFAPILALVLGLTRRSGNLLWVVIAHVGGAVIGLGWMIHLLVAQGTVGEYVASGTQLLTLGSSWWKGVLFENSAPLWGGLALLGVLGILRDRRPQHIVILAGAVVFTVLQSMDVIAALELARWEGLPDLMWRRFVLSAKPFWFVLTGVGASVVLAGLKLKPLGAERSSHVWVVAAPILVALFMSAGSIAPAPVARPLHRGQADLASVVDGLTTLLRQESETAKGVGRVAFWRDRGEESELPLIAFANVDLDYVGSSVPPTQSFMHSNAGRDLRTLRALGVKWVVSHGGAKDDGLVKIGEAGPYIVYRVTGKVAEYPVEIEGPGTLAVESWTPMHRVLTLSGTTPESQLIVLHGPYSKWTARLPDGSSRSLELVKRGGWKFSQIGPLQDGRVELVFDDTWLERVLFVIALLVLVGGSLLLFRRDQRLPDIVRAPQVDGIIVLLTVVFLCGVSVFLWTRGRAGAETHWTMDEPENLQVVALLHQQEPEDMQWEPDPYCVRPFSRNPRVGCMESSLRPRLEWNKQTQSACLGFGVPDRGEIRLRVALPEGTQVVKGVLTLDKGLTGEMLTHGKRKKLSSGVFRIEASHQVEMVVRNNASTSFACVEWVALGI